MKWPGTCTKYSKCGCVPLWEDASHGLEATVRLLLGRPRRRQVEPQQARPRQGARLAHGHHHAGRPDLARPRPQPDRAAQGGRGAAASAHASRLASSAALRLLVHRLDRLAAHSSAGLGGLRGYRRGRRGELRERRRRAQAARGRAQRRRVPLVVAEAQEGGLVEPDQLRAARVRVR